MWLIRAVDWILQNWQYVALITGVLFVLALVGKLSHTLKAAHDGFKEIMTIRGMIAFIIIAIVIYVIWTSITSMAVNYGTIL